jgi:uncharacterized membrane protein YdjX (TVP38/TMEM64 family)
MLLAIGGFILYVTDIEENISLEKVQQSAQWLKTYVDAHYISSILIFMACYIAINLWFPGAAVITLLGGYLYETVLGAIYVDTAAVIGALLGFWMSRYYFGNWVQKKWHSKLVNFNQQVAEHGYIFLILIRMIPFLPYSLVNILAGMTKISAKTMVWTTAVGSLPGILIFTYAGNQLLTMRSVKDVMTPKVIVACTLLVIFVATVGVFRIIIKRSA